MKKILFYLITALLVIGAIFVLTDYFESRNAKSTPIYKSERLISFYEGDKLGLKEITTDNIIIKAGSYKSFETDSFIIKAISTSNRIFVFNHQGTPIGGMSFDSFIDIKTENSSNPYYLGTSHLQKYYYFPKTKTFITPIRVFQTPLVICLLEKHKVSFFDHNANRLWFTKAKDITLLQTKQGNNSTFYVVEKDPNTNSYFIYNTKGETEKRISSTRWKLMLSQKITDLAEINEIKYGKIAEI